MSGERWTPGIGDPSFMGWLTVFAYFGAALVCMRASRVQRDDQVIWRLLGFALVLLGINKQLDLQSWVTQTGRDLARAQDWYSMRRMLQQGFVLFVGVASAAAAAVAFWLTRRRRGVVHIALAGFALLLAFILIRASSFHHIDFFISTRFLGARFNWIMELGGIAIIAMAASRARRRRRTRRHRGGTTE